MKKRALISVYDKTGVVDFAKKLQSDFNYEIVSTGSTAQVLKDAGLKVVEVSEVTNFAEMLSGKVKTLHPAIFGGILADTTLDKELEEISNLGIAPFSMVVVNLYPFTEVAKKTADEKELIKNIDIGGCALLRATAKNNKNVLAVSEPSQYSKVLAELQVLGGRFSDDMAKLFAQQAFALTAQYDICISETLKKVYGSDDKFFTMCLEKVDNYDLRYGENPHQKATLYKTDKMLDYEVLQGKALSFNNIIDATTAIGIVSEFYDVPSCTIIKHSTPCGVALGKNIEDAYLKALDCDPISAFGGIIALSQKVDEELAKHLTSLFLEIIIAPEFSDAALKIFETKKNLRLIKLNTPLKEYSELLSTDVKVTPFGILVQDSDTKQLDADTFKVVTKEKPSSELVEDMIFAWKVAKYVKSNAIVIAKDFKTLGICGGQTSRIDAVEIALNKACDGSKDAVLASDGFFPAIDNINSAAQGRIKAIIQPGGSIKDKEVIAQADKFGMTMIMTGVRHFRH